MGAQNARSHPMPSKLFSAKRVTYGCAPFTNVRIGYNPAAGSINMLVPGSGRGAIELITGLDGESQMEVHAEGTSCRIGMKLLVEFLTEEQAAAFETCIKGPSQPKVEKEDKMLTFEAAPTTPPRKAAPMTPPAGSAVGRSSSPCFMTPPKAKRPRT